MKTLNFLFILPVLFFACGTEMPNELENALNSKGDQPESNIERPPITKIFTETGQIEYYELAVNSGEDLFIKLEYNYRQDYHLFAKFGSTPTQNNFDSSLRCHFNRAHCVSILR